MPPTSLDLDLFVLALVQRGCTTSYDMKTRAGISIGSSAPVLERLSHGGLLKKSELGVRDKAEFSITALGSRKLNSEWQNLLATRPNDPDAILRVTYLAWALGRQDTFLRFIDAAAETLSSAAVTRTAEANQVQAVNGRVGPEAFRWLKTRLEAARLEAQSRELKQLGQQIKKQKKK